MEDSEDTSAQRDICQNDVVNEVSEAVRQTSLHWDTDYNIISKENQNDWKKRNMFWFWNELPL